MSPGAALPPITGGFVLERRCFPRFCWASVFLQTLQVTADMFVLSTQEMCGRYLYLLFMTAALSAFAFTWLYLPETRGRTFDQIAEGFRGAEGIPLQDQTGFNTFS